MYPILQHPSRNVFCAGTAAIALSCLALGISPATDRLTWFLENAPVMIAIPLLVLTFGRFPFTTLAYVLIAVHAVILMVGGHYSYAEVPIGHWVSEWFGLARNHYDRLGHLAQGFIPAIVIRELLLRRSGIARGGWLFSVVLFSCLGISALYEILEWLAAVIFEGGAEEFLGTQGDVWDTQWDMFLCGVGALLSQLTLTRWHDAQLGPKG